MNKHGIKEMLPSALATGSILVFSAIMFFMYRQSAYLPFIFGGIFLLLPASVNIILMLFRGDTARDADGGDDARGTVEEKSEESSLESQDLKKAKGIKGIKNVRNIGKKLGKALIELCRKAEENLKLQIFIEIVLLLAMTVASFVWFGLNAAKISDPTIVSTHAYWQLVLTVVLFVLAIILDKYCKHVETEDVFYRMILRNCRAFFSISKILFFVISLALTLKLLDLTDICKYVNYLLVVLFYYVGVMLVVSLAVRVIKKELSTQPGVVILLPFFNSDIKELALISFIEDNTGITLRSLWSLKYIRKIIPYAIFGAILLFWASTGIVYVESHQEAAVYRFGVLQEETLQPGLHLNLPYPIEKTEIYDTDLINKMTIGYKANDNIDNIWTESSGEEEYRLLLGSGDELVSINLRVEYKISDLKKYLKNTASPDKILEAKAYELATDRTISTDLDTLLSTDRARFAQSFKDELVLNVQNTETGLEVVNVIMESIHPPVEVAKVYQDFVAAEIQAQTLIVKAETYSERMLAQAESSASIIKNNAQVDYHERTATAISESAQMIASIEAFEKYPESHKYYRYLNAICYAYQNSRLVIIGDGVDSSRLYFGSFTNSTSSTDTEE